MPVLNIYAQDDHIIPPPTSRALDGKTGSDDYTELGLPGGHIGVFVSGKSQGIVGKGIVDWLAMLAAIPGMRPVGRLRAQAEEAARTAGPRELAARDPALCRAAIEAIPNPDLHYDDWIALIYAVKGALGDDGRDAALAWSSKSKKHDDVEFERAWSAARPERIGAGSILHIARAHGWQPPQPQPEPPHDEPESPPLEEREKPEVVPPDLSDDALASEFTCRHADELRYVAPWGKWLRWDGMRWPRTAWSECSTSRAKSAAMPRGAPAPPSSRGWSRAREPSRRWRGWPAQIRVTQRSPAVRHRRLPAEHAGRNGGPPRREDARAPARGPAYENDRR